MRLLRMIAPLIIGLAACPLFVGQIRAQPPGTAYADRPGGDHRYFGDRPDIAPTGVDDCYNACQQDSRCRAWTMVDTRRVPSQGPWARCWLKDSVPPAVSSTCCLSGVIQGR